MIAKNELSSEQKQTIEKLDAHTDEILAKFDSILLQYGIALQVKLFTLVEKREKFFDDGSHGWACCANPPPEYAPVGKCPPQVLEE